MLIWPSLVSRSGWVYFACVTTDLGFFRVIFSHRLPDKITSEAFARTISNPVKRPFALLSLSFFSSDTLYMNRC